MARKEKFEDDGRTVADMSGIERPRLIIPRLPGSESRPPREPGPKMDDRPWEKDKDALSKDEKRWYVLGALKAALLIGLAFIVGLGVLIAVLLGIWS